MDDDPLRGDEAPLGADFPHLDTVDEFGVPVGLLGVHPPEAWGAIGRTVALAALLEDRLVAMLQMLTMSDQSAYATTGISKVIRRLRNEAPVDDGGWSTWGAWLDRVEDAFVWRHHIAHNLWPAQPGGRFFGHRLDRKGQRINVDVTHQELMDRLAALARITSEAEKWVALAGAEGGRRTRAKWHDSER